MKAKINKKVWYKHYLIYIVLLKKEIQYQYLANVLIEAKDKKLILAATDMEIAELQSISCEVLQEGAVTTPAHIFMI